MTEETRPGFRATNLYRWTIALVVILALLAAITLIAQLYHLAGYFGDVISLYFAAWILQFLFAPLVDWLCSRGLGRGAAAGIVYVGVAVLLVGLLIWLAPPLVTQLRHLSDWLVQQSHGGIPALTASVDRFIQDHAPASIRPQLLAAVKNISEQVQEQSRNLSKDALSTAGTISGKVALQTFNLLSNGATVLFQIFIVAILSFFMTMQGRQFVQGLVAYLPRSLDPDVAAVRAAIDRAFGGFIRGQLLLSTLYGALVFAVMEGFALFVPGSSGIGSFAAICGVLAGLIMIIPVIGTTLSMIPPLIVGALTLHDWPRFVALFVLIYAIQLFIANIVGPRVFSESVGVNTLLTFGALLVGGKLGGVLGAFFAIPLLAVVLAVLDRVYLHLTHRLPAADSQEQTVADPQHDPGHAATPPRERHDGQHMESPLKQHRVLASLRGLRRG
ncbi:MAG TPA: AI-2E family transporter [Chloroflexota bacterium]|nr:AI-2E family transporter [Chloroflexota bacterium]